MANKTAGVDESVVPPVLTRRPSHVSCNMRPLVKLFLFAHLSEASGMSQQRSGIFKTAVVRGADWGGCQRNVDKVMRCDLSNICGRRTIITHQVSFL
eukprot:scaffold263361_cov27-Prasinocladus_malaysianus.AAC.1